MTGSLTAVGLGMGALSRVTPEARAAIEAADEVLYLLDDPVAEEWIRQRNPQARSLLPLYAHGRPRRETYEAAVEAILEPVRRGHEVCAAFYGHPGVFVAPSHEAIRRARAEGFEAWMLPAVSAEDCLIADLGVDPGAAGCQSYEATRFLLYAYEIDPRAALLLWQVGALGDPGYPPTTTPARLRVLVERLARRYPSDHEVVLYRASLHPIFDPEVERLRLDALPDADVSPMATLYVPPLDRGEADPETLSVLGLRPEDVR